MVDNAALTGCKRGSTPAVQCFTNQKEKVEMEKEYVIYREGLWQSVLSDIFTFSMLTFCVWFSAGSNFWTFVCVVLLLLFCFAKFSSQRPTLLRTPQEVREWAAEILKEETENE